LLLPAKLCPGKGFVRLGVAATVSDAGAFPNYAEAFAA